MVGMIWDLVSGKMAREDRERRQKWARRDAERREFYKHHENPSLAEFVGSENICTTCFSVTPDMSAHIAWHTTL